MARTFSVTEDDIHQAVFEFLSWAQPACVWFPIPNGRGKFSARFAALMKRRGAWKAGVSDYAFLWDTGAGAIELKTDTGRQSDAQKDFQAWCASMGVPYAICRSVDDVHAVLTGWGRL